MTARAVKHDIHTYANAEKAIGVARFFKTAKGEYGYGDIFWGLTVPETRKVAKKYVDIDLKEIEKLLQDKVHEVRLCALLLLCEKQKKHPDQVAEIYLRNTAYINNWDLVDVSADKILGPYVAKHRRDILQQFARSQNLWERRIAIITTFYFIKQGKYKETWTISEKLLHDQHDLIHKAVGWMLREVGKRCGESYLEIFLDQHAPVMPRTMLRYSIEHMSPKKRDHYMKMKRQYV